MTPAENMYRGGWRSHSGLVGEMTLIEAPRIHLILSTSIIDITRDSRRRGNRNEDLSIYSDISPRPPQWVSFCIQHPFVQADDILGTEYEVKIFQCFGHPEAL